MLDLVKPQYHRFKYLVSSNGGYAVGAVKVATEEASNLLGGKEITMATEPQPTSRHLSTQHRPTGVWNEYLAKCGRQGGK